MSASSTLSHFVHQHWKSLVLGLVVIVGLAIAYHFVDIDKLRDWLEGLNPIVLFIVITVLPLVGFPVTVLHVVAGIRWGAPLGVSLVIASIFLQLLASYALVRLFRPIFEKKLANLRRRIPQGAHGPVCLFTVLLPGVPYFLKNYVLPLVGVPLRTYLLWCLPIHAIRCSVAVIFGDESGDLTPGRIAAFAAYFIVVGLSCAWAFRRIRAKVEDPQLGEDGQTQTA
jgi:uncharacterized membrane protein YdjX (TVP38/TMEM64 family)